MIYDFIVIGGGIVGLATALKIKEESEDRKVLVLEKEKEVAMHQTGNNSGVIHSGIYYRPGSLKAKNCISGYYDLINFCDENRIRYERCGKLIVATEKEELSRLEDLYSRGIANGLNKIKKLTQEEIKEHEPHVKGIAGILLPYTGIVDYSEVAYKIKEIFTARHGGEVFTEEKVTDINKSKDEVILRTERNEFRTKMMINTSGLYSDRIAAMAGNKSNVRIIPFRGEYYELKKEKEHLVKNLIYPVPDPGFPFLGVHFTRMIKGGIEAGPNAVFAFSREGYKKNDFNFRDTLESLKWPGFQKLMFMYAGMGVGEFYRSYNKDAFTKALQRLIPELQKNDLTEGGSGVRAQACDKKGKLIDDFLFIEDKNIIHVLNTPSPAATASLSIGKTIAGKALDKFFSQDI